MKIGIVGKMCSGKTSLAKKIRESNEKFHITSFAKKIKEIAIDIFDMKIKDRKLLQDIGSKMREIDEDIWIKCAIKEANEYNYAIIDDVRFDNEILFLKANGWTLIKLTISPEIQIERLKTTYKDNWNDHYKNINHISENLKNIPENYFDLVLDADKSIDKNFDIVKKNLNI